jgi:beta-lactamase regulating signal transducer with metallopeptidase domain
LGTAVTIVPFLTSMAWKETNMRSLRTLWTVPGLCLAVAFLISFANTYGQAAVSQDDSTKVLSPAPGQSGDIREESPGQQPKILFALKTDSASILRQIAESDPHPYAWTSPDGHFNLGPEQNPNSNANRSNPGRKVRKGPLILGIAGAAVMVAGIAIAADPCGGFAPCFRTGGIVAAGVGGVVAVTGFYFAFRR